MGRKTKAKRDPKSTAASQVRHTLRSGPNWPLLVLSGIGIILTGYLSWTAFYGQSVRGCSVGSACDIVLTSRWARLFGLPTAFWGLLTYIGLAATAFIRRADRHWRISWTVALFGVAYSLYLTTISLTVLNAACPYCLTSLGLMTAILVLTSAQRPSELKNFSWPRTLSRSIPVAAAVLFVLHLHYSGLLGQAPSAEDPTARALAEHLAKNGVKFYGAYWCPHCQEQKEMFGPSATRLPYIECSPGGRSAPQAPECRTAGITIYPTWIINGQKRDEVLSLKELSDASGFRPDISPD